MPRSRFSRAHRPRIIGKKFVIVCEGITEYNYFNAIRSSMRLQTLQVDVVNPDGSDPRSIVNEAIQKKRDNQSEGTWAADDSVWAVYDGDEHLQNNPGNWNDAIQLAESNGIELAISNPNFELWFLLHFQDQYANIHRNDVLRQLRTHIPQYEKGQIYYPVPLAGLTNNAITRADALSTRIERDGLDTYYNPQTKISTLVKQLVALGR